MRTEMTLKLLSQELQTCFGDLHKACRKVGVSVYFVERWKKDDPEAAAVLDEAQRVGFMGLESAAIERAVHGVEKGVWYKGELVGTEKQYSDGLLQTLMKARLPQYSGDENVRNVFNGPTQINVMPRANTYEEWLKMKEITLERRDALPAPASPGVPVPEVFQGDYVEVEDVPATASPFAGVDL